jgi:mannosyl-oligosaccharide alpha-1,2-mannosidase
VVDAFRHAWKGYTNYAWGYDELHPISKLGSDWFHLGLTIIDSLDTALIMGEDEIFKQAREWVANELDFEQEGESNVFEITIRVVGGLLSTYNITGDTLFLNKAVDLADRLLVAFDTPSGIPLSSINLKEKRPIAAYPAASTAEAATLQMEFKYLTYLTKDPKYWNYAQNVMKTIFKQDRPDGLVPIFIDPVSGKFRTDTIRLGSRGDSYYGKPFIIQNIWRNSMF